MSTRQGRVRSIIGAGIAVVIAAGGIALFGAVRSHDGGGSAGANPIVCQFGPVPADAKQYDAKELPPPPTGGMVDALDALGNRRGTMNLSALFASPTKIPSDEKPGTFDVPVRDDAGQITGYWVPEYGGFVDLESAQDPQTLAQLVADPSLVVDSSGTLISSEELERRRADGSACVR